MATTAMAADARQTRIIDGKAVAERLRHDLAATVKSSGLKPGLAVILVGDDPASHVYVRNKITACEKAGIVSYEHRLPATAGKAEIAALIAALSADKNVHGILMQLPLPPSLAGAQEDLIQMIAPHKDVDGLTVVNAGKLILGHKDGMVPCTPQGSLILIKYAHEMIHSPPALRAAPPPAGGKGGEPAADLTGLHAVVIGRSNLFGKPMGQLLLAENCTVTQCHSKTRDLAAVCRQADILVAAVGRAGMVRGDWIKPGAIVIDVGINRGDDGKLYGDVAYDEALGIAGAITPVPGGVGPMTIACLLANTVKAARVV